MNRLTEDIEYLKKIIDAIDDRFGLWRESSPKDCEILKSHIKKIS